MATIREFDHDGSRFEIRKALFGEEWRYRIICDGNPIGDYSIVSTDTHADAAVSGIDLDETIADELERAAKVMRDLKIKPYPAPPEGTADQTWGAGNP